MSGGHYENCSYYQLEMLADEIEKDFLNDGKYMGEDWDKPVEFPHYKRGEKEYDRLSDATPEQRIIILANIKLLIEDLRTVAKRVRELDLYMSGDTGATSYLERTQPKKDRK